MDMSVLTHTIGKVKNGTHSTHRDMFVQHCSTRRQTRRKLLYFQPQYALSLSLRNFRIKSTALSSRVKRSILLRNGADFLFPFISSGFSFILSFRLELKIYQVDRLTGRTFNVLHASI